MRSAGGVRLELIGGSFEDYAAKANDEIMLVVMVETEEAIANVREIMRVPGVDVVLIGPFDLMTDVQRQGRRRGPSRAAGLEVAAASKETGTPAGYVCGTRRDGRAPHRRRASASSTTASTTSCCWAACARSASWRAQWTGG